MDKQLYRYSFERLFGKLVVELKQIGMLNRFINLRDNMFSDCFTLFEAVFGKSSAGHQIDVDVFRHSV